MTEEEQRLEEACGGERPAVEECESGLNWADCGGTEADPRFGCNASDCRWFAGGCVPSGYRGSECPPGDLCCVEGEGGSLTPFESSDFSSDMALTTYVVGWGEGVWDRERERDLRNVEVVLGEPTVVEGGELVCSSAASRFADICSCESVPSARRILNEDGFSVHMMPSCAAILFAYFRVDVRRLDDGSARAWVCHTGTTDVFGRSDLCRGADEPSCAESGTLTIERFPETEEELGAMPIELSLTLDDGRTMELRF